MHRTDAATDERAADMLVAGHKLMQEAGVGSDENLLKYTESVVARVRRLAGGFPARSLSYTERPRHAVVSGIVVDDRNSVPHA